MVSGSHISANMSTAKLGVKGQKSQGAAGSCADVRAVVPDVASSDLLEGQEEGVTEGGGQGETSGGLVRQHPLQQIQQLMVLYTLRQLVFLRESQRQRESDRESRRERERARAREREEVTFHGSNT